jgi:hypothetical protein
MTTTEYLKQVYQIGIAKGYFEVRPLREIDKSCCGKAITPVVDFDKVKERICKEKGFSSVKSCDAMLFLPTQERVDFLEMKSFVQFLKHAKSQQLEDNIEQLAQKFDMTGKIKDSSFIFESYIYTFCYERKEQRHASYAIKKQFVLLTDVDESSFEAIAERLLFLSTYSTPIETLISNALQKEIEKMPQGIQQPILKNCQEIDDYYKQMLA